MLSRAENVAIYFVPHIFSSKGHVRLRIGKRPVEFNRIRMDGAAFSKFKGSTNHDPYRFHALSKTYWLFEGKFYKDSDGLQEDEVHALLLSRKKLNQQRIKRAKTIAAIPSDLPASRRGKIPDDLKLLVWERDGGACQKCGSRVDLQFDHVIPVSVGGATTSENLQILCGACNRAKSASVV